MMSPLIRMLSPILGKCISQSLNLRWAQKSMYLSSINQSENININYCKHKTPRKRASKLLSELQEEELTNLIDNRTYPNIRPGDSIAIEILPYASAKAPDIVKGVVIGISKRKSDTLIKLLNTEDGSPVRRGIFMYNPLIKNIKILEAGFIYRARKTKARRCKLYYLEKLRPKLFTVK